MLSINGHAVTSPEDINAQGHNIFLFGSIEACVILFPSSVDLMEPGEEAKLEVVRVVDGRHEFLAVEAWAKECTQRFI